MPRGPMGGRRAVEEPHDFGKVMGKLVNYCRNYLPVIIIALILGAAGTVCQIVGPDKLKDMTNEITKGLPAMVHGKPVMNSIDMDAVSRIAWLLVALYVGYALLSYLQSWLMANVTQRTAQQLREAISQKINRLPLKYFDKVSYGDVLSRITNDVDTLGQSLNQSVTQLITSVTQIIGVLVMMLSISLPLTGVTVLTLPAAAIILVVMIHFSQPYFREQQQVLGAVNGIIEEDFAGQNVIQVFDRAEASIEEFDRQNDRLFISGWRSQFLSGLMMPLMSLVGNMGYVGVVVVGAQLALTGNATPGDIQSFIQYVRNFTQPVQQLGNVSNTMQSMAAATERVFEFLAAPEEEQKADAQIPEKRPGHVEFDHVKFGYTPDKTIIHDFSCEAQPGQTIAIVGPTGAGKTTLIKLLQRFYDVDGGSLRVEGVDVRDWDRAALRGEFAMVLQDTWLFNGTIRENIRYGRPDATDAEVEAAARAARCDHFIHTLAGGYDFMINEEGTNLSQGQRQLVTIARAILADRPALILDEATSNVDTRTEELIQRAMDALMQGRTSFVIAHRLSTVRNSDVIICLDHGRVIERGNHDELIAKKGYYYQLYTGAFELE